MKQFTLCLVLFSSLVYSQQVSNVTASQFGNNIEIVYNVSGVSESESYAVQLVYTTDNANYSRPMAHVYGDVGQNVSGNGSKKIIWDVLRETDSFEGNYAFKVILTPDKSSELDVSTVEFTEVKGRVGKFESKIINIIVKENNVVIKFTLLNIVDNENYKVHITKSKIVGPDGKAYLAKSGNQGSKDQYGFMNVVLSKDVEKEVSLLFDYVPADIEYLKYFEIIRYIGMTTSESIVFTNVNIP